MHEPIRIKGNSGGGSSIIFDGLIFDTVQEEEVAEDEEEENTNNTILNILQGDLERLNFQSLHTCSGKE